MKDKKLTGYHLFWIFVVGCVFGWLVEVIFAWVHLGRFENRSSLIYGPVGGAYGIGAIALTLLLYKFKNSKMPKVFLVSFLSGTVCEYIMSWGMELVLGFCAWDYSNEFLNINGRVCLVYSLFWGFLGILWVKIIYPFLMNCIDRIPKKIGNPAMIALIIFLILDTIISYLAVDRLKERNNGIEASGKLEVFLDKHYDDEFLKKIYPGFFEKIK